MYKQLKNTLNFYHTSLQRYLLSRVVPLAFFILAALLSNTAFHNLGQTGIPLSILCVFLSLLCMDKLKWGQDLLFLTSFSLVCLLLHWFIFGVYGSFMPDHYLFNIYFVFLFLLMLFFLQRFNYRTVAVTILVLLSTLFFIEIIFWCSHVVLGTKFSLTYLANNLTFSDRSASIYATNRTAGPWSEPSYSLIPVLTGLFALGSIKNSLSRDNYYTFLAIILTYTALTGARSLILIFLGIVVCPLIINHFVRISAANNKIFRVSFLLLSSALLSLGLFFLVDNWVDPCAFKDGSFAERFGTMSFAVDSLFSNWLGYGPKSFTTILQQSTLSSCMQSILKDQYIIHSSLLQTLFEYGLLGLPYLFFPYLCCSLYCQGKQFIFILPFILTLFFSSLLTADFSYFSGYWFFFALVCSYGKNPEQEPSIRA